MPALIKTILKYLFTFAIGVFLLWYILHQQKQEDLAKIKSAFFIADYRWIAFTIIISLVSHLSRAHRWNLLMNPLGYTPSLKNTFVAVMVGYFANIFAPRMGEVARCAILKKTDNVPLNVSFGTVVAERAFDFICLLLLIAATLLVEFKIISAFILNLLSGKLQSMDSMLKNFFWILSLTVLFFLVIIFLLYYYRNKIKEYTFFIKVKEFMAGVWQGIISIRKLNRKGEFLFHTFFIWTCYYFMTYLVFFSLPSTSGLGFGAGLVILVMGGLGMSAPVQAGMGAFHYFVREGLYEVYHVDRADGLSYAFLIHTSQTVTVLLVGVTCFIISVNLSKKLKLKMENANVR